MNTYSGKGVISNTIHSSLQDSPNSTIIRPAKLQKLQVNIPDQPKYQPEYHQFEDGGSISHVPYSFNQDSPLPENNHGPNQED